MTTRPASAKPRAARKASPASATAAAKTITASAAEPDTPPATAKAPAKPQRTPAPKKATAKTTAKPRSTPAPTKVATSEAAASPARSRGVAPTSSVAVDRKDSEISEISLTNITPQTIIAPNFMVYELTRSELADRRGIPNQFPSDSELRAAINLAREVLQPIRDALGKFTPNSVFRGHPLERALKNKPATWISTSQHARGEACDIEIVGMSTLDLANWAKNNLKDFDQIICECYDPAKGPNSGWVHISLKAPGAGPNRRQLLSYVMDHGKMVYVPGLIPDTA